MKSPNGLIVRVDVAPICPPKVSLRLALSSVDRAEQPGCAQRGGTRESFLQPCSHVWPLVLLLRSRWQTKPFLPKQKMPKIPRSRTASTVALLGLSCSVVLLASFSSCDVRRDKLFNARPVQLALTFGRQRRLSSWLATELGPGSLLDIRLLGHPCTPALSHPLQYCHEALLCGRQGGTHWCRWQLLSCSC